MDNAKEVLETEYSEGVWDYLREPNEAARFGVVGTYCQVYKDGGSILELGCGEGILQERMNPAHFSRYLGVDISAAAIEKASARQTASISFAAADARVFVPDSLFDVVVFNECLEYFEDPRGVVHRYEEFLAPNGIFIVSMFAGLHTTRTKAIWKMLLPHYSTEIETRVSNGKYTWVIKVLKPVARAIPGPSERR